MNAPIDLPTELRWRCQKCSKDMPEEHCQPFLGVDGLAILAAEAYAMAPPPELSDLFTTVVDAIFEKQQLFVPLSGPPERGHMVRTWSGGSPGMIGSSRELRYVCGPVRLTLIETQELWVEWVLGDNL